VVSVIDIAELAGQPVQLRLDSAIRACSRPAAVEAAPARPQIVDASPLRPSLPRRGERSLPVERAVPVVRPEQPVGRVAQPPAPAPSGGERMRPEAPARTGRRSVRVMATPPQDRRPEVEAELLAVTLSPEQMLAEYEAILKRIAAAAREVDLLKAEADLFRTHMHARYVADLRGGVPAA
jgi:hypothetical protein